jgi:hypothetical protein
MPTPDSVRKGNSSLEILILPFTQARKAGECQAFIFISLLPSFDVSCFLGRKEVMGYFRYNTSPSTQGNKVIMVMLWFKASSLSLDVKLGESVSSQITGKHAKDSSRE